MTLASRTGWAPPRRRGNAPNSDSPAPGNDPNAESWDVLDPRVITHRDHAVIDDDSAVVIDAAIADLTLARMPMALGDGLADLHVMVSLLAQLRDWLPTAVAGARNQGYSWADIAAQLGVAASTAKRRHHGWVIAAHQASPIDRGPQTNEAGTPVGARSRGPDAATNTPVSDVG